MDPGRGRRRPTAAGRAAPRQSLCTASSGGTTTAHRGMAAHWRARRQNRMAAHAAEPSRMAAPRQNRMAAPRQERMPLQRGN
jgi:hypothetical protein